MNQHVAGNNPLRPATPPRPSLFGRVKRKLRAVVRRPRALVVLAADYWYDLTRYARASAMSYEQLKDEHLRARLLQKAHSIEKGLALPSVRPGFGEAAITELATCLDEFDRRGLDPTDTGYRMARHTLSAYLEYHDRIGAELARPVQVARRLAAQRFDPRMGGTIRMDADAVLAASRGDFAALVEARHSVRMFARRPVERATLHEAIGLAARSPSVCNRQGSRVYVVDSIEKKAEALVLQGGNRGFTEEIAALLVVVNDQQIMRGGRERNQSWIDGGMFAMTLLYALQYVGLGACPLNWSADRAQDRALRSLLDLPDSEVVIMLIAVGHLRDDYTVALSPRRPTSDLVRHRP